MVRDKFAGVEFIAMNTDAQHLAITEAAIRIQLGERITAVSEPVVILPWVQSGGGVLTKLDMA